MSQLNISRNIFLEKEELVRFQQLLKSTAVNQLFAGNTLTYGILQTDFVNNKDFLVEPGSATGSVKIARTSYAYDVNGMLTKFEAQNNIALPPNDTWYWMRISHQYRRTEEGVCSISENGVVVGVDTKFTEVLRGGSTLVPTKIKFTSLATLKNTQVYEVVDVIDDLNMIISGASFQSEVGLRYIVIGGIAVGETITSEQEEGLYQYDSCKLELADEEVPNVAPVTGYTENVTFYIARVKNSGSSVSIEDKRTNFWQFNLQGIADKLSKDLNLSDLTDVEIARENLSVYSKEEIIILLDQLALADETVNLTDNQVIGGIKSFNVPPLSPTAPTANNQLANKKYVDDVVGIVLTSGTISLGNPSTVEEYTITFSTSLPTASYVVIGNIISEGVWSNDVSVLWILKDLTVSGFKLLVREVDNIAQNLSFRYAVIKYA